MVEYDVWQGWRILGWAVNSVDPNRPLDVEVVENGRVVASGRADGFREDLKIAGIGNGLGAFVFSLESGHLQRGLTRYLSLRLAGPKTPIVSSMPFQIETLVGFFDGIEGLIASGWACDTSNQTSSLMLDVIVDGQVIESISTDKHRPDLADAGLGFGCHGFEWILPRSFVDGFAHHIWFRFANTQVLLKGDVAKLIIRSDQLSPETRRLLYLRQAGRQHLAGIEQALLVEGRNLKNEELIKGLEPDSSGLSPIPEPITPLSQTVRIPNAEPTSQNLP